MGNHNLVNEKQFVLLDITWEYCQVTVYYTPNKPYIFGTLVYPPSISIAIMPFRKKNHDWFANDTKNP